MKPVSLLLAFAGLLAFPTAAQRLSDDPATHDPFGKRTVAARAVPGGRYAGYSLAGQVLTVRGTDGSQLHVTGYAAGVVRVDYFAPGRSSQPDPSVSVLPRSPQEAAERQAAALRDQANAPTKTINSPTHLQVPLGDGLVAVVQKNPLQLAVLHENDTLVAEATGAFSRVTQTSATTGVEPTAATFAPGGTAVRFRLAPGERLYGTGSRALPLDRRGYRLELYNQAHYASQNGEPNLNIALPVVLSSRGYLLLFDHHTAGYFDLGKTDPDVLEYGGEGLTSLSYFVVTGNNQAQILDRYTELTGRQPLPPRWALGLIQSRFGYKTQAEMAAVAARMRRENFPLDALVLDLYWFGGTRRQGDFAWDQPNFPDPAGMMAGLKKQGVNTILISEPYVMRTSRNDSTVRTLGLVGTDKKGCPFTVGSFWAGPASILDVFKPSARTWLWDKYKALHEQGAAGWWSDLGEPENHPEAMHHAAGLTRQVHNAYGQSWASIFQENYTKTYPDERLFNLARSGWAGMQRNAVFPWSGDINRSWSGLQAQVPGMVGMGQAGVGYMHSDAGGFCVGGVDSELYTRWLQMASLCPVLRPHGEGVPPEPYWYSGPYKDAVRAATHLRYELLPYLYSLAYENSLHGSPIVRTVDFDQPFSILGVRSSVLGLRPENPTPNTEHPTPKTQHPTPNTQHPTPNTKNPTPNTKTSAPDTQYLLGPNLLVAPVLQPSQRRRNVVLPAGSWIDYHTNHTYPGGHTVGVVSPLARIPLLVRAGAFLPMTAYRPSTALYRPDTLLLRYYPDPQVSQSEFTMYDDDGHSAQALARRQYETFTARGFTSPQQTDILLSSAGEYPGQPVFRLLRLLVQRVAAPPTAVLLDGVVAPAEGWNFNPRTHELEVHFLMNAGTAVSLRGLRLLTAPLPDLDPDALTLEAPDSRSFGPGGTTLHYTRHRATRPTAIEPDRRNPKLENRHIAADAWLTISNSLGQVVFTEYLSDKVGAHTLRWNANDKMTGPLPAGVYVAEVAGQHQRLVVTQ